MNFSDPIHLFAGLLLIGAGTVGGNLLRRRIRSTQRSIQLFIEHNGKLAKEVRELGRDSLRLKRSTMSMRDREAVLLEEITQIEQSILGIRRSASPLVVLDENKTMGDTLWEVPVSRTILSGGEPQRWRTFLVWAPSTQRAYLKVLLRYPESGGYRIGGINPRSSMPSAAI